MYVDFHLHSCAPATGSPWSTALIPNYLHKTKTVWSQVAWRFWTPCMLMNLMFKVCTVFLHYNVASDGQPQHHNEGELNN